MGTPVGKGKTIVLSTRSGRGWMGMGRGRKKPSERGYGRDPETHNGTDKN